MTQSRFAWATITDDSPLRVRLDGDTAELPFTPDSLVDPLAFAVGDRVRCELSSGRVIVLGRAGGSRPMRLGFATKSALAAFAGWPGLIGFVEADNSEYLWQSGWKLWNASRRSITPGWANWATPGNSTSALEVTVAAGRATFELRVTVGSTAAAWGDVGVAVPAPYRRGNTITTLLAGTVRMVDVSASRRFTGLPESVANDSWALLRLQVPDSPPGVWLIGASSIFAPSVGDGLEANWSWPLW